MNELLTGIAIGLIIGGVGGGYMMFCLGQQIGIISTKIANVENNVSAPIAAIAAALEPKGDSTSGRTAP